MAPSEFMCPSTEEISIYALVIQLLTYLSTFGYHSCIDIGLEWLYVHYDWTTSYGKLLHSDLQ